MQECGMEVNDAIVYEFIVVLFANTRQCNLGQRSKLLTDLLYSLDFM